MRSVALPHNPLYTPPTRLLITVAVPTSVSSPSADGRVAAPRRLLASALMSCWVRRPAVCSVHTLRCRVFASSAIIQSEMRREGWEGGEHTSTAAQQSAPLRYTSANRLQHHTLFHVYCCPYFSFPENYKHDLSFFLEDKVIVNTLLCLLFAPYLVMKRR